MLMAREFKFSGLGEILSNIYSRFLYVRLQLDDISGYTSVSQLEAVLERLPRNLDEHFDRALAKIRPENKKEAKRLLTWLAFSKRPLTVHELLDALTIDVDKECIERGEPPRSPDELLSICPDLITIDGNHVSFVHFSVQQYLTSHVQKSQEASSYFLESCSSHDRLAKACLIYLMQEDWIGENWKNFDHFPLAYYAAFSWHEHWRDAKSDEEPRSSLAFRALKSDRALKRIIQLRNLYGPTSLADWFVRLEHSATPLMYSSRFELTGLVRALLDGPDLETINQATERGDTALFIASHEGHPLVVQLLLDKGADIDARTELGQTPLMRAAARGKKETAQLLLEKGANKDARDKFGWTPLITAAVREKKEIVQLLLEKGADIDASKSGWTPLMLATGGRNEKIVKLLVEKGADIQAKEKSSQTPLMIATRTGKKEIVQLLLEKGADIDARDEDGWTPLKTAAMKEKKEIVQLLLEKGADIHARNQNGQTPLMIAAWREEKEIVRLLLERGADIDVRNKFENTPLMAAVTGGEKEMVQLLLEKGADTNARNKIGNTPLKAAKILGRKEMVQLLREHNEKVRSARPSGRRANGFLERLRHFRV